VWCGSAVVIVGRGVVSGCAGDVCGWGVVAAVTVVGRGIVGGDGVDVDVGIYVDAGSGVVIYVVCCRGVGVSVVMCIVDGFVDIGIIVVNGVG